jgi:hypothetical protein
MNLSPEEFLKALKTKTEAELNRKEHPDSLNALLSMGLRKNPPSLKYLIKHCGHTTESGEKHLNTDYSNGFTICKICGSFYKLGKGFTKHLSNGCLHCEGEEKHRVYFVHASKPSEGGFPARYMSVMFDDGMSYCKDRLEVEKFKELIN